MSRRTLRFTRLSLTAYGVAAVALGWPGAAAWCLVLLVMLAVLSP